MYLKIPIVNSPLHDVGTKTLVSIKLYDFQKLKNNKVKVFEGLYSHFKLQFSICLVWKLHYSITFICWYFFLSDTDTKFNGITAFPESSTIVTGLRYKDKYKGHVQKQKFPHI